VLIRGAAALILILHISGGSIGILSGTTALLVRKGSRLHRLAGNIFFISMLTMSGIGACVAPFLPKPDRGSLVMGIFTFYLVASAWMTVRRKEGSVGVFEKLALFVVLACTVADLNFGLQAAKSPTGTLDGNPSALFFVSCSIMALTAVGDFRMILRGGVSGAQRIVRHVWRMCFTLFIATGSFFLGQQKVMPAFMHGSPILVVLGVAPLLFMIFWLCRVQFTSAYKKADVRRPMRAELRAVQ
jgi:uncharacterized membrane protein